MAGLGKYTWIDYDKQTDKHYQIAINYYNQKTNLILNNLLKQLNQKLIQKGQNPLQSTEQLIETMSEGLNEFITQWEQFYNSKPDINKFRSFAKQYNELMQRDNKNIEQTVARAQIIKLLIQNEIITKDMGDVLPPTLNFSALQADINTLANGGGNIGNRTNIMSEIFEQGGRYFANSIGNLLNDFTVGTGRITNLAGKQIKPDALIVMDTSLKNDIQEASKTSQLPMKIDLEETLIDLSKMKSIDDIINTIGLSNEALGITMKMWTEKARHQTMGYFLSQGDIDRDNIHSQPTTRRLYNAYVHSKYLINIIGALNGLIVGGQYGLQRTDAFLLTIFNKGKGIMAAKDKLNQKSGLEIKSRYTGEYKRFLNLLKT